MVLENFDGHDCLVNSVDEAQFKTGFTELMTYIDEHNKLLKWTPMDIALKIDKMIEGLFKGMSGCSGDSY